MNISKVYAHSHISKLLIKIGTVGYIIDGSIHVGVLHRIIETSFDRKVLKTNLYSLVTMISPEVL